MGKIAGTSDDERKRTVAVFFLGRFALCWCIEGLDLTIRQAGLVYNVLKTMHQLATVSHDCQLSG